MNTRSIPPLFTVIALVAACSPSPNATSADGATTTATTGTTTGTATSTATGTATGTATSTATSPDTTDTASTTEDPTGSPLQPPIGITFDLHPDPFPQNTSLEVRRVDFQRQLDNIEWLLDTVEPYGVKISFLAAGEFYEFCLEESERDACFPIIERLYQNSGVISTHHHDNMRAGAHDWPAIDRTDPVQVDAVWADNNAMTNEVIRQALGIEGDADQRAINVATESHVPEDLERKAMLMEEFGYTVREGGGDQILAAYFGHQPFQPFRPGDTVISEDLSTPFVTVPQGMVIGEFGDHANVWQDGRAPHKTADFLQLLVNWSERERLGEAPKVWSFGWGAHSQDFDPGSPSRQAVEEFIPWLSENMVNVTSGAGHPVARFASYIETRDQLIAWEEEHPGESSFDYPLMEEDFAAYPYLEWANRYLRVVDFEATVDAPEGLRIFRLAGEGHPLLLVIPWGASEPVKVDASSLGGAEVRRVDLTSGDTVTLDAADVEVGPGPALLCLPEDCDAILAIEPGGDTPCAIGCEADMVCCPDALPCAGQCVPDCRVDGNTCPPPQPTCNPMTGLCSA